MGRSIRGGAAVLLLLLCLAVRPTTTTGSDTTTVPPVGIPADPGTPETDNPFGTCDGCDPQVFIGPDCTQAYVCDGNEQEGYLYECDPGYLLSPDFGDNGTTVTWTCYEDTSLACPGAVKIFCNGTDDAVPDGGLDDPDRCECNGQVYITSDCKHADRCREMTANNYILQNANDCQDNETIQFDFRTWETTCAENVHNCPGQGGFALGCQEGSPAIPTDPLCNVANKNFTEDISCECDNQVFVSPDCSEGFVCKDDIVEDFDADGCLYDCPEGQKLYPEFYNGGLVNFTCIDEDSHTCPGAFNINCDGDAIDPENEVCACEGELFMAPDCHDATFCILRGGEYVKQPIICEDDDVVDVDFATWEPVCVPDNGGCPGAGGFRMGCGEGGEDHHCGLDGYGPDGTNGVGTCDCNDKVYINADCSYGLLCSESEQVPEGAAGCGKTCAVGDVLVQDLSTPEGWTCSSSATCLGHTYEVPCPETDLNYVANSTDCISDSDIVVTNNCTSVYFCDSGMEGSCAEDQEVLVVTGVDDFQCFDGFFCPPVGGYFYRAEAPTTTTTEASTSSTTSMVPDFTTEPIPGIPPNECVPASENPIGNCSGCDPQVFLNTTCSEAFICTQDYVDEDPSFIGCLISCNPGYKLVPDFGADGQDVTWTCISEIDYNCLGEFHVFCEGEDGSVPEEGLSPSDGDHCTCDGEIFVTSDCKHSDRCRLVGSDSYTVIDADDCNDNETVQIDYATWELSCATDVDNCPGQGGFSLGCTILPPVPVDCTESDKTFLEDVPCSCDNQAFLSDDCSTGFTCQDQSDLDGCVYECPEGTKAHPTFYNQGQVEWDCVDEDIYSCPGEFYISCPAEEIDPATEECGCEGELLVSSDCTTASRCLYRGGEYVKVPLICSDEQIVQIDFETGEGTCQEDTGGCPYGGGFRIFCAAEEPSVCGFGGYGQVDTYGFEECECNDKFYVNEDCSYGLLCNDQVPDDFLDGCAKTCAIDQLLVQDLTSVEGWACVAGGSRECIGAYTVECPGTDLDYDATEDDCTCNGEIFVTRDCTSAFICDDSASDGGRRGSCDPGQVLEVVSREALDWYECREASDGYSCTAPGGYYYDCLSSGTSSSTPSTTDNSVSGGSSSPLTLSTTEATTLFENGAATAAAAMAVTVAAAVLSLVVILA